MKHLFLITLFATLTITPVADACDGWGNGRGGGPGGGKGAKQGDCSLVDIKELPFEALTDDERTDIIALRQEEKLARDVYRKLYSIWGTRPFSNISAAEQRHMDRMEELIKKYDITDPAVDDTPGVFVDEVFSKLYQSFIERGAVSLSEAYQVGLEIENLDIADIDKALARTDNQDTKQIYDRLRNASERHKSAFTRLIEQ